MKRLLNKHTELYKVISCAILLICIINYYINHCFGNLTVSLICTWISMLLVYLIFEQNEHKRVRRMYNVIYNNIDKSINIIEWLKSHNVDNAGYQHISNLLLLSTENTIRILINNKCEILDLLFILRYSENYKYILSDCNYDIGRRSFINIIKQHHIRLLIRSVLYSVMCINITHCLSVKNIITVCLWIITIIYFMLLGADYYKYYRYNEICTSGSKYFYNLQRLSNRFNNRYLLFDFDEKEIKEIVPEIFDGESKYEQ